jgi:signal peptidase I
MEPNPSQNSAPASQKASFWTHVLEWVKVIIIALVISLPIRFFIAEPFIVNGASMDPTFATGQFLIVDRLTYRLNEPKRGDVIVFQYPNDPSKYYIKRIIGLPSESLDIKDGTITITKKFSTSTPLTLDEPYVENIHRSHETIHLSLGASEYFVMGDNRLESSDSRSWGPLEKHFIVGRPIVRLLPVNSLSILPGEYKAK